MGRDKAFIDFGGSPMAAVAVNALRNAGASTVRCVGGDQVRLRDLGLGVGLLADDHPGEGPLGALLTAFERRPDGLAVVLTCDLPLIDATVVRAVLHTLLREPGAAVAAPRHQGRLQLLTAAYRPALVLGALRHAFAAGERAVRAGLAGVEVLEAPLADDEQHKLRDADTPGTLAAMLAAAATESGCPMHPGEHSAHSESR